MSSLLSSQAHTCISFMDTHLSSFDPLKPEAPLASRFPENTLLDELQGIIEDQKIRSVFQAIIDLKTGEPFAYEALSRIEGTSSFKGPDQLFKVARHHNLTYRLEQLCREKAIRNAARQKLKTPLTLNVCPSILKCPDHEQGKTMELLEELQEVKNNIILELTETYYIKDHKHFAETVKYYRQQGFRIAIDDLGAGYTGLNMVVHQEPYLVKLDRDLISHIHQTPKKQILVESLVSLCHKLNALVVAEGIEEREELETLMALNVDLGQGYFLAKPEENAIECYEQALQCICAQKADSALPDSSLNNCIGSLAKEISPVDVNEKSIVLAERFKKTENCSCIPVVENNYPVGIVEKSKLYFKLGQRYGYDLFSRKSVKSVMEDALIIDSVVSLEDVSKKILSRDSYSVYDSVIVTHDGKYLGLVSIDSILQRITDQKISLAKQANPLSGLPGNNIIKEEISMRLEENQIFSVLYFDIDHFKPFNDNFGFDMGDKVIQYVGDLLNDQVLSWDPKGFVGHIGGDDFVAVCRAKGVQTLCENIIEQFDHEVKRFHPQK